MTEIDYDAFDCRNIGHILPAPPDRFRTRCKTAIDPKRVMRGSSFCSNECRREDLRQRRDFRASKACRLCGRPPKRIKPAATVQRLSDGSTAPKGASGQ